MNKQINLQKLSENKSKVTLGFKCEPGLKLDLAKSAQQLNLNLSEYVESLVSSAFYHRKNELPDHPPTQIGELPLVDFSDKKRLDEAILQISNLDQLVLQLKKENQDLLIKKASIKQILIMMDNKEESAIEISGLNIFEALGLLRFYERGVTAQIIRKQELSPLKDKNESPAIIQPPPSRNFMKCKPGGRLAKCITQYASVKLKRDIKEIRQNLTLEEIAQFHTDKLLTTRNFGVGCLVELTKILSKNGLQLHI